MTNFKNSIAVVLLYCLCIQSGIAQIGIGTTTPEGALDLETTTQGLVYPRVTLTSTDIEAPVTNPNGPSLVVGTVVYNTNATNTGTNDVYPGIYAWGWDSSQSKNRWMPQFTMEDYKLYQQDAPCQRTGLKTTESQFDAITGLNGETFTPKYSGTYKIKVNTNYGAGKITDFYNNDISINAAEGNFYFECIGPGVDIDPLNAYYDFNNGWIYTHSYATYNKRQTPNNTYENVKHYVSAIYYKELTVGETYTFSLMISMLEDRMSDEFVGNGNSGDGRGHVGHDIPCSVEFTYLGE